MKLRVSLVLMTLALAASSIVAYAAPANAARPGTGSLTTSADGTTTGGAPVTGTFKITRVTNANGVLWAVGTFTGSVNGGDTLTTAARAPIRAVDGHTLGGATTAAAAAAANGSCQILSLTLGPLHLDVLGLVVDLNQVNLNITAQQGSGNLLGNLLCAVAGLLDNNTTGGLTGLLQSITTLLNQILAQL